MKTVFFLLLLVVLGVVGWRYYERQEQPTAGQKVEDLADKTRDAATAAKDKVADKAEDLKLTPADIKQDLAQTGQVVRSKARVVGEIMDDARIVAMIKGRYVVDRDLSALAISVSCRDGEVRLTGSASSEQHIGKAVTIALQTRGVHNVISQLTVKN
ncbi:MAG: hypothetical protein JWQ62_1122 [Lacunisphaera sp.]|nr:hypothetical protein [Lacunisphaera sp.]